ncbi:hypothetical protein [Novosphingobium sp. PP1Y]|uniref:hypothetical protein n=1 Tax=Novosphingobium sp. PP1Y TaxID=702113 RepID=UPI00020EFB47|nr:hypothetical protein [Novosphingobium sp. PP1Y]CCA90037.1 conserved hypothetical protein [Novosphingobium sp. PP1Y]
MKRFPKIAAAFLIGMLSSSAVLAQAADAEIGGLSETEVPPTGPYGAVMEYDSSIRPAQTIYRPRDLGKIGRMPIVVWGSGGCRFNGGAASRRFLLEVASYGYFIVAPGNPGPDRPVEPTADRVIQSPRPRPVEGARPPRLATGARGARPPQPGGESVPGESREKTLPANMEAAIDWAVNENDRDGSAYRGKLAVDKIAASGRSCGGLLALSIQQDPRVKAAMIWNSGIFGRPGAGGGVEITKDALKQLHTPVLYVAGGADDVAHENAVDDVSRINHVPVFFGEIPTGHPGTMRQANGGSTSKVAVAWLDWQLKGDERAGRMFSGEDCELCRNPVWTVVRKNMK